LALLEAIERSLHALDGAADPAAVLARRPVRESIVAPSDGTTELRVS